MDHKEKAIELVNKFFEYGDHGLKKSETHINYECAKQCALILVDERLIEIDLYFKSTEGQVEVLALWNHYVAMQRDWEQVKQEIEKL